MLLPLTPTQEKVQNNIREFRRIVPKRSAFSECFRDTPWAKEHREWWKTAWASDIRKAPSVPAPFPPRPNKTLRKRWERFLGVWKFKKKKTKR